ncbi:MAG TPA: oligopeptide ABC transporter ATP-binding protein [Anaerolineaceae bacterium]|nr:oligopeptide ABC transporter ATP-binding protein [Anaerolineaceae bacterium]
MLELDHVSKIYKVGTFGGKELHAVRDVSFSIQDGEVVSLIGESGSGKSTIGKMVLRLISISDGSITIDGEDISKIETKESKEYYRKVQGVFQDPYSSYNPIFKADRIFHIIHDEFYPDVDKHTWDDKVNNALQDVGLNPEHVLGKFPHQLSGGQLQRFLIARALLLDIKLLVADEIISMLDASVRIDVLNLLADLKTRGLSVLFITHDLSLANYISESAIILYRGCILERGSTEKIFDNPLHPYTQMLISAVPRLDQKWATKVKLDSEAAHLGVPTGCVYYDRCPYAFEKCKVHPEIIEVSTDHHVACWKVSDSQEK